MRSKNLSGILQSGPRVKYVSSMKQDMAQGINQQSTSGLSSDQKVLRQQIYAAIRRMDSGELSASQFKDRMMQIGIEIPPEIIKMLMDHNSSGSAKFNTFAAAFERLLEQREAEVVNTDDTPETVLPRLAEELRSRGQLLILQRLAQAFKVSVRPKSTSERVCRPKSTSERVSGQNQHLNECQAKINFWMDTGLATQLRA